MGRRASEIIRDGSRTFSNTKTDVSVERQNQRAERASLSLSVSSTSTRSIDLKLNAAAAAAADDDDGDGDETEAEDNIERSVSRKLNRATSYSSLFDATTRLNETTAFRKQ